MQSTSIIVCLWAHVRHEAADGASGSHCLTVQAPCVKALMQSAHQFATAKSGRRFSQVILSRKFLRISEFC